MNRCLNIVLVIMTLLISTSLRERVQIINVKNNSVIITEGNIPSKPLIKLDKKPYSVFIERLAKLESGGLKEPYKVINRYGYMGKYQFSKRTLKQLVKLGYLDITKEELKDFLNRPYVQEKAIRALIAHNKQILTNYGLMPYIGKTIGGVTITLEGMLAGAHLVGPYAVKHFIKTGGSLETVYVKGVKVTKFDGNGTSIINYMKKFEIT